MTARHINTRPLDRNALFQFLLEHHDGLKILEEDLSVEVDKLAAFQKCDV